MAERSCPDCGVVVPMCSCDIWDCGYYAHLGHDCPSARGLEYAASQRMWHAKAVLVGASRRVPLAEMLDASIQELLKAMTAPQARIALHDALDFNIRPLTEMREGFVARLNEAFAKYM